MKIIPLSEGAYTIDATKLFVPFDEETDQLQQRPTGSLLVEIQPFAVVAAKDILLLDTGLGFAGDSGELKLHRNLRAAGIEPAQVTKVLMTHLHKDHAGGVGTNDKVLNFPNATYYVQRRELDFAFEKGFPSYITQELGVLRHAPQVRFLHDDEGQIDGYITYRRTGAHSPHHQVFWIRENGETVFFGGDDAPQLQQMKMRYKTKYDFEPDLAMNLRQQWWQQGRDEKWKFLFYHDIKRPVVGNEE